MKKILISLLLLLSFLILATPTLAANGTTALKDTNCVENGGTENGIEIGKVVTLDCAPIIFFNIIYWLLVFSGVVALFFIIFGGFRFMTSGGDPKQVDGARSTITWAIIGLVVVLLSFATVKLIADITGVSCITKFGFVGTCKDTP